MSTTWSFCSVSSPSSMTSCSVSTFSSPSSFSVSAVPSWPALSVSASPSQPWFWPWSWFACCASSGFCVSKSSRTSLPHLANTMLSSIWPDIQFMYHLLPCSVIKKRSRSTVASARDPCSLAGRSCIGIVSGAPAGLLLHPAGRGTLSW